MNCPKCGSENVSTERRIDGMKQEYEYEVWQDHAWQAGGSTETPERAIAEADHYAMMYGQDGPVEVRFYVKQEVTRAELEERQAA